MSLKSSMLRSVSLLALAVCALSAQAVVLDFDDLDANTLLGAYRGYTFNGFAVVDEATNLNLLGNTYAFPTSSNALFNNFGLNPTSFTAARAFSFQGAYVGSLGSQNSFGDYSATSILVEGYLNGSLVGSVTASLRADGLDYVAASFARVDEIRFTGLGAPDPQNSYYLVDSIGVGAASAVPGPVAALPFALIALKRRKRV